MARHMVGYGLYGSVETQVGSKNAYVGVTNEGASYLRSYATVVAASKGSTIYRTNVHYSVTTSTHINAFVRQFEQAHPGCKVVMVSPDFFTDIDASIKEQPIS